MQRSGSQKVLLVLSILSLIGAVISLLGGIIGFVGGGVLAGMDAGSAASLTAETGLTQADASGMMFGLGIGGILSAIISLIEGILGLRASKDATKVGPVWVLALVGFVLGILGVVVNFAGGMATSSEISSNIISALLSGFMFWICNNIKKQANA